VKKFIKLCSKSSQEKKGLELISLGTNNRFIVEPREVFYTATSKNLSMLFYNNTRRILEPSEKDKDLTD